MKTTAKDFRYFEKRCGHWAHKYGLQEWDLYTCHADLKTDAFAETHITNQGCCASITLNKDWCNVDVTDKQLDRTAKHEVIHIMINNLSVLIDSPYITADEHRKAEEALVVKLCKLLPDD